jgi:hypothetical protein
MMYKHINVAPPEIDLQQHPVPAGLNPALQKALSKNPDDRYPRVNDFAAAMQTALRDAPSAAAMPLAVLAAAGGVMATKPPTAGTELATPSPSVAASEGGSAPFTARPIGGMSSLLGVCRARWLLHP